MSTSVDECRAGLTAIANFHSDCATYLSAGGVLPEVFSVLDSLDYSESLTYSNLQPTESGDFGTGAVQESMAILAATAREVDMASRGKTLLFLSAAAEYEKESDFYIQSRDFYIGVMKGSPTSGSQS